MPRNKKTQLVIFTNRVQEMRKDNGLSQAQLAGLMGVSEEAVQSWESLSNYREPSSLADLIKLAGVLNVSTDYLLGITDEHNSSLRDVAKTVGISQTAVRKLKKALDKYGDEDRHNIALNGLIMSPDWDAICQSLLSLRSDLMAWCAAPHVEPQTEKRDSIILSGEDYFRYRFDSLISFIRVSLSDLLRIEKCIQAGNTLLEEKAKMEKARAELKAAIEEAQKEHH